jgi:hypothetical protein
MRCVRRRQLQDHGRQRPVHTLRPAQVQRLDVALRQLSPPYPVFCRLCQHRQLRVRARSVRGRDRLHALVPPEHVPERGKPNELQGLPARQLPGSLRSEASSCVSCPANSAISPPGPGVALSNCSCIVGYIGPEGGPCAVCVACSYKSVAGEAPCEQCPAGSYAVAGSSACDACPAYSSSAAVSQALPNCTCATGYEARADPFFCAACAAGGAKLAAANTACEACAAGSFAPHSAMTACPADTFSSLGSAQCANCSAHEFSTPGADSAEDCLCVAGFFRPAGFDGNSSACDPCALGFFRNATHAQDWGSLACLPCPDGFSTFSVATVSADGCQQCPAGAYTADRGGRSGNQCHRSGSGS